MQLLVDEHEPTGAEKEDGTTTITSRAEPVVEPKGGVVGGSGDAMIAI